MFCYHSPGSFTEILEMLLEISLKYTKIWFLSSDRYCGQSLHPVRPRCRTVQLRLWSRVHNSF